MILFFIVLQGLYLETILWCWMCSSLKYVHATCIFAFIFLWWATISVLPCCPAHLAVCFNVFKNTCYFL